MFKYSILILSLILTVFLFSFCGVLGVNTSSDDNLNNPSISSASGSTGSESASSASGSINTNMPASPVRLIFLHHSCGGNWLSNGDGNLGKTLNDNNYYVSESDYGWDAQADDNIGDHTDTPDWPLWFNETKMPYVYASTYHSYYTNTIANPGGENEVIMFKSCYPLSEVDSSIDDEKAIYNGLLNYFSLHQNKLFILITPPGKISVTSYGLTRDLCNWLVDKQNGWLKDYNYNNVAVYDFYCTLSEVNSHHRVNNGSVEHVWDAVYNGASPYHSGDDHPNSTGNQKASAEYIKLLNYYYNIWKNN